METQSEIYAEIESLIPKNLWEKYNSMSFAEMADVDELEDYKEDLLDAEKRWFSAADA